jgi:PAS domain-containing protein
MDKKKNSMSMNRFKRRTLEKRYRHVVESSNDRIGAVEENAVCTYAGPQCRALLG